jgi:dTDP-4-amino-4,6-dideoxygalactose transaminase
MKVKFVDLAAQNAEIKADADALIEQIHSNTSYVGGQQVCAFESAFAEFIGVKHVVGISSGTDALRLVLLALGIRPGDSVITTPMTFIATAAAIVQTGARPVFVDIDPATGNISSEAVALYLKNHRHESIRAILPVDLYGLPAPLKELREVAAAHGLKLVEDACQAHGASIRIDDNWKMAGGALADAACFSFYPGKNLGAWGDGGAVATDDDELAERVMRLRDHGRTSHYAHDLLGYNARLDTLQTAVLTVKLARLPEWNQRRRRIANLYRELLAGTSLDLPYEPDGYRSCYHLYVLRSHKRDTLREALANADIPCGIHYPIPLHLQPACKFLGYQRGDFPYAEKLADTALSLPMHPHLSVDDVEHVANVIRRAILTEEC